MFRKKNPASVQPPCGSELLIRVRQLSKIYHEGKENEVRALDNITLDVPWGQFLCYPGAVRFGKIDADEHSWLSGYSDLWDLPFGWAGSQQHAPFGACGHP